MIFQIFYLLYKNVLVILKKVIVIVKFEFKMENMI